MSDMKPVRINHFEKDVTMVVKFQLTREFYIRKWIATRLIVLAAKVLNCGIKFEGVDDE